MHLLTRYARQILLSALTGVLAGTAAAIFLIALKWATDTRTDNHLIIMFLPVAGFFIGWVYYHYGRDIAAGTNLILDEIHNPKKVVPIHMAPFILLGTVITHLFGGSAGREGTAVQMGASLADQLHRFFKIGREERKILLMAGAGAGFGAAIGAPWAGMVFGMEVIYVGRVRLFAWLECWTASFVGYFTAVLLRAPHTIYPSVDIPTPDLKSLFFVTVAGVAFGLAAQGFTKSTHVVERTINRWITYPPFKPMVGGLLVALFLFLEGSFRFAGLGLPYISQALLAPVGFEEPLLKSLFTSLTIGSGFKGGEFIPLVFIGTTLGSALSIILPVSFALLAAVGFAAVFAGASNTPLACTIMAMELFGYRIGPFALIGCLVSFYFSGHRSIYSGQVFLNKKHHWLSSTFHRLRKLTR